MTEHDICKELIKWRDLNVYRYPCLKLLYHVANEGKRDMRKAKELGMLAGLPDYHMPVATTNTYEFIGFWLEIKAPGKKPTEKQLAIIQALRYEGHYANWVDNLQAAIDETEKYCQWVHKRG